VVAAALNRTRETKRKRQNGNNNCETETGSGGGNGRERPPPENKQQMKRETASGAATNAIRPSHPAPPGWLGRIAVVAAALKRNRETKRKRKNGNSNCATENKQEVGWGNGSIGRVD